MALTPVDRLLIGRCLDNDPGAWADFVNRFSGLFCHVVKHSAEARSISLPDDDIDDLAADVFSEIVKDDYRVLRTFREKSSLATYLSVIARRVVVRNLIAKRRLAVADQEASNGTPSAAASPPSTRVVDDADEIEAMLKKLPEREATLLRLYHLEGALVPRNWRDSQTRREFGRCRPHAGAPTA